MAAEPAQYPTRVWHKSHASETSGNCVEVAFEGLSVLIRDSRDNQGPVLVVEYGRWLEFVRRVRTGDLSQASAGGFAEGVHVGDGDVAFTGLDDSTAAPFVECPGHRRARYAGQAGEFLLCYRHLNVHHVALCHAVLCGKVDQQPGDTLRADGCGAVMQHGCGFHPAHRHHLAVCASSIRMVIEKRIERLMSDDQRSHRADAAHRSGAISSRLAGEFADDVAWPAQREHDLLSVTGDGQDLHPAGQQHEYVRGRFSLDAQRGLGRQCARPAGGGKSILLGTGEKLPESLVGSRATHLLPPASDVLADGSNLSALPQQ